MVVGITGVLVEEGQLVVRMADQQVTQVLELVVVQVQVVAAD
jgi:hypothetical protein